MTELTSIQKAELIEDYVNILIDSMSTSDLIAYVSEDLTNFCEKLTDSELKEEISLTLDDDTLNELVDNVTELTTQEQLDYINSNLKEVN
tara:strand:+ start:90 stop:359 length:270 start_codon:yes stop_codon:yes gene_type:complete